MFSLLIAAAIRSMTKLESAISALAEQQFHSEGCAIRYRVFERSKSNTYAQNSLSRLP
jgi:hypothetical protein